jgi:hypothetical protein
MYKESRKKKKVKYVAPPQEDEDDEEENWASRCKLCLKENPGCWETVRIYFMLFCTKYSYNRLSSLLINKTWKRFWY